MDCEVNITKFYTHSDGRWNTEDVTHLAPKMQRKQLLKIAQGFSSTYTANLFKEVVPLQLIIHWDKQSSPF